jgi:hypothetical protein
VVPSRFSPALADAFRIALPFLRHFYSDLLWFASLVTVASGKLSSAVASCRSHRMEGKWSGRRDRQRRE